jgi:UDP-N-acetylglucosamine acyltransferase
MQNIHPTAIINKGAQIADNVTIGPYCVVGEHVTLQAGVKLVSHVSIEGHSSIGEDTVIYPFASLGHAPQDLKYQGEASRLEIGANNVIREHVTMNPGTRGGGMRTKVGDKNLFMVGTHVAHDCRVGNHVILANNATLAGHVEVGDHAIIGGLAAVHQFVRIGNHAMIGGMSAVENDVIPFGSVTGERASLSGLNLIGLKRRQFDRDTIHALRNAYKDIFETTLGVLEERTARARVTYQEFPEVIALLDFIKADSHRALCTPKIS